MSLHLWLRGGTVANAVVTHESVTLNPAEARLAIATFKASSVIAGVKG